MEDIQNSIYLGSLISAARPDNVDDRHCNDIMLVVHSKMHMAVHEIHSK
jgi:hypothetical protein